MAAAAGLLAAGGADAATTRAVADAAGVQAPTIYRLFGDKQGLLEAVAEQTLADYVDSKARRLPEADPVTDLRAGCDAHVAFGLANPAISALINAPQGRASRAAQAGVSVLRERVRRVAQTGRLRVSEERAVDLLHAMGTGTVLALLQKPAGERDGLAETAREAVFAAILDEQSPAVPSGMAGMASALRAGLDDLAVLTPGERHLLSELLHRIANASDR
ncbi:TetR/AcrR family transcriptional regulator [Beijerinckia sp. L45]|uniref:TetR/AcrR family transcriptional regulator n=1 Tax=Beijerinckia sp. L45 TaxID=1641855 RepID=UPI001FEF4151|nr:TetR/AcrR family transcriptional regulator [Beijerinckia sp. L45]